MDVSNTHRNAPYAKTHTYIDVVCGLHSANLKFIEIIRLSFVEGESYTVLNVDRNFI